MGYEDDDEDDYAERLDLRGAVEREDEGRWLPYFQQDDDQDDYYIDEPEPEPEPEPHYVRRKKLWKKR